MPAEEPDEIRLQLPADPQFARVARVAMAAVGVRIGLPVIAVEDLRIALDEALILLLRRLPSTTPAEEAEPTGDDHAPAPPADAERTADAGEPAAPDETSPAPAPVVVLTLLARPSRLAMAVQLVPAPPERPSDADDEAAEGRFQELVPARVAVDVLEPAAGLVRLRLVDDTPPAPAPRPATPTAGA